MSEGLTQLPPIVTQNNVTDYESIRQEHSESLDELWDDSASFAENLRFIFEQSICIPDKDIQLPIFLAYASLPSALSSVIPILFLQGQEGSGKSLATILLSGVFGCKVLSSATTFAAIRNSVQKVRWTNPEAQEGEVNCAVIFDNVNAQTLKNESLYTFFLNGYNRKTDSIEISKGDGTNMIFKVFSPKICSSIHPVYSDPRMSEIARRMIVLKFARLEKISAEDLGDFDIHSRLEIESMDLSLLARQFWRLWDRDNAAVFMELRKQLTTRKKTFKVPKSIKSTQWALCPDLIAAGIVSGVWGSIQDAINGIEAYWEWHAANVANNIGAMEKALRAFISDETAKHTELSRKLGLTLPNEVKCDAVKYHLDNLARSGALDQYPTPQNVTLVMNQIGYRRELGSDGSWVWIPAS